MMQLKSASSVAQALSVMVEATSLSSADASKLTALLQNSQESEDDSMGAPAAAVYKGKSGGIIETMQDLFEKAEAQLEEAPRPNRRVSRPIKCWHNPSRMRLNMQQPTWTKQRRVWVQARSLRELQRVTLQ